MNLATSILKATTITVVSIAVLATAIALPQQSQATAAREDALAVFKSKCVVCHAADGSGSSTMGKSLKAPDLRSDEVQKKSDAQLSGIISKGKGKMPAYAKTLSAEVINGLVAHIRTLKK